MNARALGIGNDEKQPKDSSSNRSHRVGLVSGAWMPVGCAAIALGVADAANGYLAEGFCCPYIDSSAGSDSDRRA